MIIARGLKFLGRTGHDRHGDDLGGINVFLLGVIGFGYGAEHLLWGFAGGHVIKQIRIKILTELDPARRTGGKLRQRGGGVTVTGLTMGLRASTGGLDAGNQLGALFHNGEVGAEVGIKHLIKTKHFERSHHLALDDGARRHAELLTNGDTGGRCGLHDYM